MSSFKLRLYPFLVGFVAAQKLNVGGEIYVGEILFLIYLMLSLRSKALRKAKELIIILSLGAAWSIAQLISDQLNETPLIDSVKGVGSPVIYVLTILGLSVYFMRDISRMPSFLAGAYGGLLAYTILFPSEYFLTNNAWKWGLGGIVLGFFSVYFSFFLTHKRNLYLLLFITSFSLVSIVNDSRSMATFPAIAAILYIFMHSKYSKLATTYISGRFSFLKLLSIFIPALFVINSLFTIVFSSGWVLNNLPEQSAEKFKMQATGEYGVLLGGRNEILASVDAFLDKPLLGHGSWAKDKSGYQDLLAMKLYKLGYKESADTTYFDFDLIPAHSHLFGALVWAGVVGGIFWIYMSRWLLLKLINNSQHLGFYYYNGIVGLLWSIMFSPFGAGARWSSAIFIASIFFFCRYTSNGKVEK